MEQQQQHLPQCATITKTTQKQCRNIVSRLGETHCRVHGGLAKNGQEKSAGFTCGHITADNVACKHKVKKEGELCAWHTETKKICLKCKRIVKPNQDYCKTHDPELKRQRESFVPFGDLNLAMLKAFAEGKELAIIQDLTKWYLELAEAAQKEVRSGTTASTVTVVVSDDFVTQWYINGQSAKNGKSFGEVHKADPLKVMLSLPGLEKFKKPFEEKLTALAADPKNGALKFFWDRYQEHSNL